MTNSNTDDNEPSYRHKDLSEDELDYIESNYWTSSHREIGEDLGYTGRVISWRAREHLDLPKKTFENRIEYVYGVPAEWMMETLHHTLEMPVSEMSDKFGVADGTIRRCMDSCDVDRRTQSEAIKLAKAKRTEEELERTAEKMREMNRKRIENGTHPLKNMWADDPEKMREYSGLNSDHWKGVTGQAHPNWRGGKNIYYAVKHQLPGSWNLARKQAREDADHECENGTCGVHADELGREMSVHHIVPVMWGGTNGDWNLTALCPSCHKKAEHYCRRVLPEFGPVLVEDR